MTAHARKTDPTSSHIAAARIEQTIKYSARSVADLVARYEGYTSAEIAQAVGGDRHKIAKRLPDARERDLVRNGPPRTCRATGSERVQTWFSGPTTQVKPRRPEPMPQYRRPCTEQAKTEQAIRAADNNMDLIRGMW